MTLFNEKPKEEYVEVPYKQAAISPFAFVNAIHHSKEQLIVDEWSEKQYNPFIINKSLSFGADTVIFANEMNARPHLDKAVQNSFLINSIRPRKRFNKWEKKEDIEAVEIVKAYYGYSTEKALQVLPLFTEQHISMIKEQQYKGGK